ncbi:serine arginine-rich splicing factor [Coemansia javaensis]|uniref:Serine arginine-rich splicing factor n=1 Tax=Coemansia javaensis TaxID=2761396 RepID=A0A9W8LH66_9FUNG|nr:serine arginine-rich splicing factor [Coemansia javaensis]
MSRLYVGRLPRDVRERDIERLFKGYGEIRDICLLSGFGFVEFRERRDAEDVMHDFNNREFMGERLMIEPARVDRRRERYGGFDDRRDDYGDRRRGGPAGAPQRTPYRVLVENLSSSVSWQDLKDFARRAGEVSFADAHKLRPGEGIVEFADESGLRNALRKLDGEDLRGRRVVIREDNGPRGGGGDRSYSRRSRSRSPGGGRSPYRRPADYRSRSPPPRRRSSRSRSRSPRSASPRGRADMPPPPPPAYDNGPDRRSPPASPRSPGRDNAGASSNGHDLGGEPEPAVADDAAGSNWM